MREPNETDERSLLIAAQDAKNPSPEKRAEFVLALLKEKFPELTEWDLICFSANYLGYLSSMYEWLLKPSVEICRLIYTAHYQDTSGGTNIDTGIRKTGEEAESLKIVHGFDGESM